MNRILRVLLLLPFILTGCEDEDSRLEVTLILRDKFAQESDSFTQGESIEFFLTVSNNSDNAVILNFSSGLQYDFYIKSSSNVEVWRWSDGKVFTQAQTEITVPAHDTVHVSETWNQELAGGENIAIGRYTASGSFPDKTARADFYFAIQ